MGWTVAGYAALAALGGMVFSAWHQIKEFIVYLKTYIIYEITFETKPLARGSLRLFFLEGKMLSGRNPWYGCRSLFIRSEGTFRYVSVEAFPQNGTVLYWYHNRLYWVQMVDSDTTKIAGFRWTINADELALEATKKYQELDFLTNSDEESQTRFLIRYFFGAKNLSMAKGGQNKKSSKEGSSEVRNPYSYSSSYMDDYSFSEFLGLSRILTHDIHDLTTSSTPKNSIDSLILPPIQSELVEEAQHWFASKEWYEERRIPWKRGWLFEGQPGTGKTIFARTLAEMLGIPLLVFDLSSMDNEEFHGFWLEAAAMLPAIILIEDFDTVFHGRNNISKGSKEGGLTFDCLINHLDGIDQFDGRLLILTTNHGNAIDDAIAKRAGRIDRVIEFPLFGLAERLKMASRILVDYPEHGRHLAETSPDMPAVDFQELCCREAQRLYWDAREAEATKDSAAA